MGSHSNEWDISEGDHHDGQTSLGLDVIHQLTKEGTSSLYVTITLQNGTTLYEMYDRFSVSVETGKYQLLLTGPATGTLGDSMRNRHDLSGMYFSTPDRDNDKNNDHCAATHDRRGGWWFNACHYVFLNGPWNPENGRWSAPWSPTVRSGTSVTGTKMMIKRH
ncbi:ficolin-1-like [Saccostrea cucullata]|uniref:ficolin-1-like n=1 Tax=Saccostrea cuccullata TaxID=36930 RepID=UPI002ED32AE4